MSNISIHALPSAIADASRLASRLGVTMQEITLHQFPDGELLVTVGAATPTAIIYAPLDRPNDKLLAVLFAADALRRAGAKRLVLLAPYLCYMRQDAAFHRGEAISQKVIGRLLAGSMDRVITIDAHLHRTAEIKDVFPGIDAENLSAMAAIASALQSSGVAPGTIVVGPDIESRPWVCDLARQLGLEYAVAQKVRHGDRSVELAFSDPKLFSGRPVILIDDIVSSGGTLMACAKILKEAGASTIDAVITHALFPAELTAQFSQTGIRTVRSTNSVPHPTNAILLDDLFAAALDAEMMTGELTLENKS